MTFGYKDGKWEEAEGERVILAALQVAHPTFVILSCIRTSGHTARCTLEDILPPSKVPFAEMTHGMCAQHRPE